MKHYCDCVFYSIEDLFNFCQDLDQHSTSAVGVSLVIVTSFKTEPASLQNSGGTILSHPSYSNNLEVHKISFGNLQFGALTVVNTGHFFRDADEAKLLEPCINVEFHLRGSIGEKRMFEYLRQPRFWFNKTVECITMIGEVLFTVDGILAKALEAAIIELQDYQKKLANNKSVPKELPIRFHVDFGIHPFDEEEDDLLPY
jgi:hypothetical protein